MTFTPWLLLLLLAAPAVQPDLSGIVSIFSYRTMGRGCPISDYTMLTARHLAVGEQSWTAAHTSLAVVWSDGTGASGSAWTIDYDLRRDVALMQSDRPFGHPYPLAASPPAIGDEVVIAGYEFGRQFGLRVIKTTVLNLVATHLIVDDPAESGFSGSCVLNARNEVVGIFHWGLTYRGRGRGVASSVWGPWGSVGWLPQREP